MVNNGMQEFTNWLIRLFILEIPKIDTRLSTLGFDNDDDNDDDM